MVDGDESDGDYFEVGKDGKVKLKGGKKKIDISKLTSEDLVKLGIDPNASKEEVARQLKVWSVTNTFYYLLITTLDIYSSFMPLNNFHSSTKHGYNYVL